MVKIIFISQIVISALLIVAIILQNRGGGLSAVFGGTEGVYRTKRGLEKGLFVLTIILAILFVALGVTNLVISS